MAAVAPRGMLAAVEWSVRRPRPNPTTRFSSGPSRVMPRQRRDQQGPRARALALRATQATVGNAGSCAARSKLVLAIVNSQMHVVIDWRTKVPDSTAARIPNVSECGLYVHLIKHVLDLIKRNI